jgi:hypothetical protein
MKTKLSELVKSTQGSGIRTANISYSWHRANGNSKRMALVVCISKEALMLARFREGDTCDIEFDESDRTMTILFGEKLQFSCCARHRNSGHRQIKVSSKGIESVMSLLPKNDRIYELTMIQTVVGKIRVRLPSPQ